MGGEQPLVAHDEGEVVRPGVEGQPAGGLAGVDEGAGAVGTGGGRDPVEVGEPPVGGLDGADGDEGGAGPDAVGEPLQRDGAHPQVRPDVEGVDEGGEVAVGDEDFGSGGQGLGDQASVHSGRCGDRDPAGRHSHQAGEAGAGVGGGLEVAADGGRAAGGGRQGRGDGGDGLCGRQPGGGGVEIGGLGGRSARGQAPFSHPSLALILVISSLCGCGAATGSTAAYRTAMTHSAGTDGYWETTGADRTFTHALDRELLSLHVPP
ncbi:hypothetical protein GCM10020000_62270 [Streptomyces olivoverticillatus]